MAGPITTHRFTVDEYHRMAEAGIFHEDDRVELIDGQVVEMTPIGPAHASCVKRLLSLFAPLAGGAATLSVQDPVILGEHQEPQPDIALLRYRSDGYRDRHPHAADVLLVVEVADRSLPHDRDTKVPLCAAAAIPEAWLVDLGGDRILVHRDPGPDGYRDVATAMRGQTLAPSAIPDMQLDVGEVLG